MSGRGRILMPLAVVVLAAAPAYAQSPSRSEVRAAECIAIAAARVPAWQAEGLPTDEVKRRERLAAASCMGKDTDSATAVFVGAVNVELKSLAHMFMAGSLNGAEHLARMRDRGRKLRLARANASWAADWVRGDADGDLVPNSLDKCAGTKAYVPTYDNGCPSPPLPPTSNEDDDMVRALAGDMGVMVSRACAGAAVPDTPSPVRIQRPPPFSSAVSASLTLVPAANQPADCLVLYEIVAESYLIRNPSGASPYQHVLFRDSEGVAQPGDLTFTVRGGDPGARGPLAHNIKNALGTRWRVRAINGAGLNSPWSGWADHR